MRQQSSSSDFMPMLILALMGIGISYSLIRPMAGEWVATFLAQPPLGRLIVIAIIADVLGLALLFVRGIRLLRWNDRKSATATRTAVNSWRTVTAFMAILLIALLWAARIFLQWNAAVHRPGGLLDALK